MDTETSATENDAEVTGPDVKAGSQGDALVEIAANCTRFMHDARVYADIEVNGHRETLRVNSTAFRRWLSGEYFRAYRKAARGEALAQAIAAIEAATEYGEGTPKRERVFLRSCLIEDRIVIDLGNEEWSAVVVAADGWEIVKNPPVRFRRTDAMLPLPIPVRGGSLDSLRRWLNVADDDSFVLTVSWMLYALRGEPPFPHLDLYGEQGTGKTTFARIVKALTDPSRPPVRTCPTNAQDFWVGASRQRVIAFDNVSSLPAWLSDALCQVTSGGGFSARLLYSNDEEAVLDAAVAPILNGIEDFVARADLADRATAVTLAFIREELRLPEKILWAGVAESAPKIFGALLDGLVTGLRRKDEVRLERLPRMADFALWGAACETAYWPEGTFTRAYAGNREATTATVLESDALVPILMEWVKAQVLPWVGTPGTLLENLNSQVVGLARDPSRDKFWPKSGKQLAGKLRRLSPALRRIDEDALDITVEYDRAGKRSTVFIRAARSPEYTASTAKPQTSRVATGSAVSAGNVGGVAASNGGNANRLIL